MRGYTTPIQDPLYDLRDWDYSPINQVLWALNHPHSAFALCKNPAHLGALAGLQDKQSDSVKRTNEGVLYALVVVRECKPWHFIMVVAFQDYNATSACAETHM